MKNKLLSALLFSFILLVACDNIRELDQETVVAVYVNIVIAEETFPDNLDSLKFNRAKVFESFGVTEEEYKYTIDRYKEDKDYWDEFFKKSLTFLDSLKSIKSE